VNSTVRIAPWLALVAITAVLDLVTKSMAFDALEVGEIQAVIPGVLEWTARFNPAGPWSWGLGLDKDALRWLLPVISCFAVGLIGWMLWTCPAKDRVKALGLSLLLGGALGNLWDRGLTMMKVEGYEGVRDFILFPNIVFGDPFPAFNLADTWITVGVILVAWRTLREESHPAVDEAPAAEGEDSASRVAHEVSA
jgi:signal peptidase II